MQYVERNGCCLNIDEKIKLGLALGELMADLSPTEVWFLGKITGVIKDYFLAMAQVNGKDMTFWCSSSSMIFSELPCLTDDAEDLAKLGSINNLFTGEFDSVLFPGTKPPKVIDADMGITLPPKAITELDRLAYVVR